jgi:hypothetical protein
MDVKGALKVYCNFKLLQAARTWGDYPVSCSCKTCFAHFVCADTLLFVSLFKPTVQVPKGYLRATVSERKQCKKVGGLAGRRNMSILEERQGDEKVIHSKALLLAETPPPGRLLLQNRDHRHGTKQRPSSFLRLYSRPTTRTTISR